MVGRPLVTSYIATETAPSVPIAVGSVRCSKEKREVCVVWTCCAYELARSPNEGGAVCELTINNFFSLEHKNVSL